MIRKINKILFTTDLSISAIDVFEQTVSLAYQTGASIVMLHVIEDVSSSTKSQTVHLIDKDAYEAIRNDKSERVKNVLIGKAKSVPVIHDALQKLNEDTKEKFNISDKTVEIESIQVIFGDVAENIVKMAKVDKCDLIVMGHHHKGSVFKAMTPSARKRILKQTNIPVMLVPLDN